MTAYLLAGDMSWFADDDGGGDAVIQEDADKPVSEPEVAAEKMDAATDSEDELPLKPKKVKFCF